MVIAAAILLVAAVVFAVVHWVIPALNKEINPPDPTPGPVTDPTTDPSGTGDITPTPNPDGDDVVFYPGPVVPESQQVSEKWFDDAVILGDSRSQGLILYNSLSNCTSLAVKSLSLTNYTKKEATLPGLGTDTVANLIPKVEGKRFYLIFGMCDESFTVNCTVTPPDDVDRGWFMFFVNLLNQIYWVFAATAGALLGYVIHFDTTGIEFVMTALFVVMFLNQWEESKDHLPALVGLICSAICLLIFGSSNFIVPSMIFIIVAFTAERRFSKKPEVAAK